MSETPPVKLASGASGAVGAENAEGVSCPELGGIVDTEPDGR